MPLIHRFLIVDDNADARSLLTRTLIRKFPQSIASECGDADTAVLLARSEKLDAIVVHRAGEITGLELIPLLRKVAPSIPIVYVSGIDRSQAAIKVGATAFLNYDAWLGLGTLIASLIETRQTIPSPGSPPQPPQPPAQPLSAPAPASVSRRPS